ncbi:MAG: hypothetical protein V1900_04315 [Candidatus Aenigmatarchaeota archaeon]
MSYKIGVSSGWWKIDRPADLLGLATKVGSFGGTAGVSFIQADLDTTSEFFEPRLVEHMKRIKKKMGMDLGLHAEVGELMALESSERRIWDQSHLRLVETVRHAADLDVKYINVHLSNKPQLLFLEAQYRVTGYFYPVVGFDGRPLYSICDQSKEARKIAEKHLMGINRLIADDAREKYEEIVQDYYRREEDRLATKRVPEALNELRQSHDWNAARTDMERQAMERAVEDNTRRRIHDEVNRTMELEAPKLLYEVWRYAQNAKYNIETAEIAAYNIVGAYMKEKADPIWSSLCGSDDPEKAYVEKHPAFNAAVAARYIRGHLEVKWPDVNKRLLDGMSVLEWLEKKKIVLAFEIPEAQEGHEGLLRLFNPLDGDLMIRTIGSPMLKLCIDFEHMLAHKLKVEDFIKKAPADIGKDILLFHIGKPIPYFGMAHAPIPIGSRSQEIIYGWLYQFRKKGFRDGYLIYERGGGKSAFEIMQNSVWVMRQLVKYLELDTDPDKLPADFYGVAEQTKEIYARQFVTMREHAWDPLEGLLTVPEEKHTFFSKAAVDKQKGELWEKRKYR